MMHQTLSLPACQICDVGLVRVEIMFLQYYMESFSKSLSNIWSTITVVLYLGYYIGYYNFVQCFSPGRWRYVHLVFTFDTLLLHLMEKPCYLSLGLVHTATTHSRHARDLSVPGCCAETLWDMVNPLWWCSSMFRPVLGVVSVNKQQ